MVEANHHKFAVEMVNGKIRFNLTQMAKPYGKTKQPSNWLATDESKSYLNYVSVTLKIGTADLVRVRQGGIPGNQGTWCYDHNIAVEFAHWLSPEFAFEVNELVWKLITQQATVAEPFNGVEPVIKNGKPLYNYLDALTSCGRSRTSGSVSELKRKFKQHFELLWGRNFITIDLFQHLKHNQEYHQLKLDFFNNNKALGGATL